MEINKKKKLAAGLSIVSNVILTLFKIIAGMVSCSMSIISEAIHSASDLLASALTFFSVVKSSRPADNDHPYGHGKYEDMAGFIEGLLIIFASFYIVIESSRKIVSTAFVQYESNLGIIVMFFAVIVNCFVSSFLFKTAKESQSVSLYADAQHLRADIYSSLGVFLGLVLIKITGYYIFDPIIAIFVATYIFRSGMKISKDAWMRLTDHALPDEDIEQIKAIVFKFSTNLKSIKARQIGPTKDIDLVLRFYADTSICECHKICDEIEKMIQEIYQNSSISIHSEPICYGNDCKNHCVQKKIEV